MLKPKHRIFETDKEWNDDVRDEQFSDHVFQRVSAKNRRFTNVDFRYSTFENCYLRNCVFDSCNFTGCRFIGTNLTGTAFSGSTFDYVQFERTAIESDVLDTCCPALENIKSRFARSLRVNYQSLGDSVSANKAILVELEATRAHLYKAWSSNEAYYRKKYQGLRRLKQFLAWLNFRALDLLWGNGESPLKLGRSVLLVLILIGIADAFAHRNPLLVTDLWQTVLYAPQVFLGTVSSPFPGLVTAAIVTIRLVMFGLFLSILVRRFARR